MRLEYTHMHNHTYRTIYCQPAKSLKASNGGAFGHMHIAVLPWIGLGRLLSADVLRQRMLSSFQQSPLPAQQL